MNDINYGAWGGLASSGDSFLKAYQAGQQRKLQMEQLANQQALQKSEENRNNAMADFTRQRPKIEKQKLDAAYGDGSSGSGVELSPKEKEAIGDITKAFTNTQQMKQFWDEGKLSKQGGTSGLGGLLMSSGLGQLPGVSNTFPAESKYKQSAHEWANNYAKATFGRTSNDMIRKSQELAPIPGEDDSIAGPKFNEALNTLKGKAEALVNTRLASGDKAGANAIKNSLGSLFGDFRMGDKPESVKTGVSTNYKPQGMDRSTAQAVMNDFKANPEPFMSDPEHMQALKQAKESAPDLGW